MSYFGAFAGFPGNTGEGLSIGMTRREARELAFILLFEKTFTDEPMAAILEAAGEARDVEANAFALTLAEGTAAHLDEADTLISAHSHKWSKGRISRVALSILRLAVFEMLHIDDIPVSVSINEAVELAKKYGGDEDSLFVNGVLGGVARRDVSAEASVEEAVEEAEEASAEEIAEGAPDGAAR